jgi:hypothetical protein
LRWRRQTRALVFKATVIVFPTAAAGAGIVSADLHDGAMQSAKFVPDTTSTAMPVQVSAFDQRTKMLLERIAACAGQFDGLTDGDATMFAGKLDNLQ